ncbi:uncharacterized protein LOC105693681 isoform X3 [Athalia rosae]|uniref:uncharacterized protein LOC105693681 isoform X3 n=1 Tax=Athalia rosae TaxID=37344 RepID=UPI00203425F6|nr:uncharacterized protein LOC105693681 isoform X3 [Athalia rosae]XP_048514762.1 uncharacterized protein LOC105693681 isoform X3 [Athalia rosae]
MSRGDLILAQLSQFISDSLQSTDDVRNILQSQCAEARFALAPWPLETIERRELDIDSCTCIRRVTSEEHANDIANGIERAVAQARQFREKLAVNILEEKKLARKPNVQQIYASGLGKIKSNAALVESKKGKKNGCIKTSMDKPVVKKAESHRLEHFSQKSNSSLKKKSSLKLEAGNDETWNKTTQFNAVRSKSCGREKKSEIEIHQASFSRKKIIGPKKITDKKLTSASPYNTLASAAISDRKTKEKKNFIAANKSSIKHMRPLRNKASLQTNGLLSTKESLNSPNSRSTSSLELKELISRISLESNNELLKSSAKNLESNGCLVHDPNTPKQYVEKKIFTTIDVTEGLDRLGVPPDLVKILKKYHSYLNGKSTDNKVVDKRGEKATDRFLTEFQIMNRTRRKESTREKLDSLCVNFMPVLKESYNKNMDFIELSKLKIRYTDLDSTCKLLNIRNFSPVKRKISRIIENRCQNNLAGQTRTWKFNGIWNETYITSLEGLSRTCCIRYANKNQLLMLFEFMQGIQQFKYHTSLIDLLINDVIPSVRDTMQPKSEEYVNAYKMISMISNILHMKVPVLVRTDK